MAVTRPRPPVQPLPPIRVVKTTAGYGNVGAAQRALQGFVPVAAPQVAAASAPAAEAAPPAPVAPAPPPAPEFDFNGPLDEQGERQRTDLDFSNRQAQSNVANRYAAGVAELDAREPGLRFARDRGILSAASNAAARGLAGSGIEESNRGDVWRKFLEGSEGIARERRNLATSRQSDLDRLNADYQQNMTDIRTGSIGRRYQLWREANGGL